LKLILQLLYHNLESISFDAELFERCQLLSIFCPLPFDYPDFGLECFNFAASSDTQSFCWYGQ